MSTSAPQGGDASGAPAAGPGGPGQEPPVRGRARGGGTAADMVRSLLIIVALVVVVVFAVPRPQGRIQQPVDVPDALAQAASSQVDVTEPDVPASWTPNLATFEPDPQEGLPTLTLGWVRPDGTYVGVRATRGATPTWTSTETGEGQAPDGAATTDVGGVPWQRLVSSENPRRSSLLLDDEGTSYVVTGTAPVKELAAVAAQVVPPPR